MNIKKILKRVLTGILALIVLLTVLTIYTPYPASYLIKSTFEGGVAVAPENYNEIKERVVEHENIKYKSAHKQGTLDIFMPKDVNETLPVVLWIHGGAFVGGDKNDIDEYATQIADKGYVVVSMNYQLSPYAKYPTQLTQVAEVYAFMNENKNEYNLDMDRLFLAGDSAGAHMAAQFAMIQTDPSYAALVGIDSVVDKNTIKGVALICGPYDLEKISDMSGGNKVLDFFLKTVAWAYLGDKNWMSNPEFERLSITDHLSKDFPAAFVTDGTVHTFTTHGLKLSETLEGLGVSVDAVFYDEAGLELQHEYQFKMDNEYSVNTFNKLITFLDSKSK